MKLSRGVISSRATRYGRRTSTSESRRFDRSEVMTSIQRFHLPAVLFAALLLAACGRQEGPAERPGKKRASRSTPPSPRPARPPPPPVIRWKQAPNKPVRLSARRSRPPAKQSRRRARRYGARRRSSASLAEPGSRLPYAVAGLAQANGQLDLHLSGSLVGHRVVDLIQRGQ